MICLSGWLIWPAGLPTTKNKTTLLHFACGNSRASVVKEPQCQQQGSLKSRKGLRFGSPGGSRMRHAHGSSGRSWSPGGGPGPPERPCSPGAREFGGGSRSPGSPPARLFRNALVARGGPGPPERPCSPGAPEFGGPRDPVVTVGPATGVLVARGVARGVPDPLNCLARHAHRSSGISKPGPPGGDPGGHYTPQFGASSGGPSGGTP